MRYKTDKRDDKGRYIGKGKIKIKCSMCELFFLNYQSNNRKYCSRMCYVMSQKNKEPWNKGVGRTDEVKLKISKTKTGIRLSEEHKRNIRLSHIGMKYKPMCKEGRLKISRAKTGLTGERAGGWIDGRYSNKDYVSWQKNHTNRAKRKSKGNHSFREWLKLKNKYNNTCLCCGKKEPIIKLTQDHIKPLSRGGSNYIENIQPLCGKCNSSKYTKIINYKKSYVSL